MVSRRKRSNSSVGNKLNNLTDKVTGQQKLQQVSGTQTNAVTNDSIALGAVNTESVADRSITSDKIGRGEVTSENLGIINEIVASGGLDIETGVDGHLSLSGGKYEAPYDGIEDSDGYKIVAFDPTDNTVKIIDETPVVNLDNILDVDVTGATDNQVLAYDEGTSTWGPATATIDYLSDVTITSPSVGQGLVYNSSGVWVNSTPPSYNYIINGAFDFWQRGTSSTVSGEYLADRWYHNRAAGTHTVSRSTDVPSTDFPQYSLSFASTSGTNPGIYQYIESNNSIQFAGKEVTISIWAKSTVGTGGLSWQSSYPTTVDDWTTPISDSSGVFGASMTVGAWTRYSATFTTNALATRGYRFRIYRDVTTTSTTTLYTGAQLELGGIATPFRRNSPNVQAELETCKRYYENFPDGLLVSGYTNSTTIARFVLNYAEKRVSPSATASGGAGSFAISRTGTDPVFSSTAVTFFTGSKKTCTVLATTTGLVAGQGVYLYIVTSAGNIALDAEL